MAKKRRGDLQSNDTPGNPSLQPQQNLPTKRQGKATRRTSAPLYKTPLNNFIYALTALTLCIIAFYSYKIMVWKTQAGGWWNLAMGRSPAAPPPRNSGTSGSRSSGRDANNVEAKISELASAFGIPPATLATAIASAVSSHANPTSLSSISENAAPTASVVQSLVRDEAAEASESAHSFINKLSNVVGFDDAGADLD
jgi:hypothetical protein